MVRKVESARTLAEVEALRDVWQRMQSHPNSDFGQYIGTLKDMGSKAEPYVLCLMNDTAPEALLIGRRETLSLDIKLGYQTLWKPQVKGLTFIYSGCMGRDGEEQCKAFIEFICAELNRGEADVAWFNSLATESNLFRAIRTVPAAGCKDSDYIETQHWSMTLPATVDAFWGSMTAKHRYWLKRLPKVLEKDHAGKVRYRDVYECRDVDELCADAEMVASKTYQRGLRVGFANSEAMRTRLCRIAGDGQLRAYLLYVEDKPVAFWIGQAYGRDFHLHYTGFDPEWRKHEVGTILFVRMIEDVITRDAGKVTRIDFGLGDASYKRRFGDSHWQESSLYLYAPTLRGRSISAARAVASRIERTAKSVLERWKLEERVKRFWRQRKAEMAKPAAEKR